MTTIDFLATANDADIVSTFGYSSTPFYGFLLKTPNASDVVLDTLQFRVDLPSTCTFDIHIYVFASSTVSGSSLFTQSNVSTSSNPQTITISPGITLDSSKTYIIFAEALSTGSGGGGWVFNSSLDDTNYGAFFFLNTPPITDFWVPNFLDTQPIAFKAVFSGGTSVIDNSLFFATY